MILSCIWLYYNNSYPCKDVLHDHMTVEYNAMFSKLRNICIHIQQSRIMSMHCRNKIITLTNTNNLLYQLRSASIV